MTFDPVLGFAGVMALTLLYNILNSQRNTQLARRIANLERLDQTVQQDLCLSDAAEYEVVRTASQVGF